LINGRKVPSGAGRQAIVYNFIENNDKIVDDRQPVTNLLLSPFLDKEGKKGWLKI
jgi:hypothetical protein